MVNKELVKKRFEKSIETYPDNAIVQKQIAQNLVSKLIQLCGNDFAKVFEIGCGAGLLTKNILENLNYKEFIGNDITDAAEKKVKKLSQNITFIKGDCESITFPQNLDLIISNSTFQWVNDLEKFLDNISMTLKPKGIIAFSTFGEQNLYQIKEATGKSLNYYNKKNLEDLLTKKFHILYSHEETVNLEFDTAKDILKHLKLCGVNCLESPNWTRKNIKNFEEKLNNEHKNSNGKLVLTYHPISIIAILKDK